MREEPGLGRAFFVDAYEVDPRPRHETQHRVFRGLLATWCAVGSLAGCYGDRVLPNEEIADFVELWKATKALECQCLTSPALPGGVRASDRAECFDVWLESRKAQRYAQCLAEQLAFSEDGLALIDCYRPAHEAALACAERVECPSGDGAHCESLTRSGSEEHGADRPSVCIYRERLSDVNEALRGCLRVFD
ncbi:MAG: hypothetical protein H6721_28950 [Sandaracinus sp.]|nr:hypothetical protein [Sandaracinus sp.]